MSINTNISYKDFNLRKNQIEAIKTTIENDFESGIYYHATGAGKSWIAMMILLEYNRRNPKHNILWICERKDILVQQFSRETIKNRNFTNIINGKRFNILDFTINKASNWTSSINSSFFWGKPFLCIINRSFLTSQEKYKEINQPIHMVIHDECHSIENKTTQTFYKWLFTEHYEKKKEKYNSLKPKIIGFSATPELQYPLEKIISKYSIYDAFKDNIILKPRVVWFKYDKQPKEEEILFLIKREIEKLPYKKIIVWSGMIKECIEIARKWRKNKYFSGFDFCIDFCNNEKYSIEEKEFGKYEDFYMSKEKSIMFCAVKHREGSDIPNIDGCIFMDKVEKRSERVFVQSLGRVLRRDKENRKKYGLIIDVKAKSSIEICNRVQKYLKIKNGFPFEYEVEKVEILNNGLNNGLKKILKIENKLKNELVKKRIYFVNTLSMKNIELEDREKNNKKEEKSEKKYTKEEIKTYFKRSIPVDREKEPDLYNKYEIRLNKEMEMFLSKNIFGNIIQALDILKITKNIPHITRGSCGSSLICYMLGISHIDPVKYNISFARFMNRYRNTLPDIDFDFPHYLRDEVFLQLYQKWGSKIARISNHNYYHEKSALREALRQCGIRRFISKYELQNEIQKLDKLLQKKIQDKKKELDGTFRGFSLHCGGIIYYPEGVPEEILLENKGNEGKMIQQVRLNKIDVSKNKNFKIDILSSRGLSQLYYCYNFKEIDFNDKKIINDEKTKELLCRGDNIGITLGETPLMRKAMILVQPECIEDVAICLSIIRPAAKNTKKMFELGKICKKIVRNKSYNREKSDGRNKKKTIIYDDDAIHLISRLVGCDEEQADKLRRGYVKEDEEAMNILERYLQRRHPADRDEIKRLLGDLRKYGFCKAHAYSYAQLVWFLAYQKANNPYKFWKATIKNIQSNYRKWVHIYEAKCEGVDIECREKEKSIYAQHRGMNKRKEIKEDDKLQQMRNMGYWLMKDDSFYPNCYSFQSNGEYIFRGLVACSRMLQYGKNSKLALTIGVGKKKYIDLIVKGRTNYNTEKVIVEGKGKIIEKCGRINNKYKMLECENKDVIFV